MKDALIIGGVLLAVGFVGYQIAKPYLGAARALRGLGGVAEDVRGITRDVRGVTSSAKDIFSGIKGWFGDDKPDPPSMSEDEILSLF